MSWQQQRRRKQQQQEAAAGAGGSSSKQQPQAATSMCPLERMTKYKYKFEKSWQKWLSGQHLYTIVSIGIPMEVAARFKRATFKLSCKTQAKRKKYRLTPIAFPHGNEPFNCKQNRFPHPPVDIPLNHYKIPLNHYIISPLSYQRVCLLVLFLVSVTKSCGNGIISIRSSVNGENP